MRALALTLCLLSLVGCNRQRELRVSVDMHAEQRLVGRVYAGVLAECPSNPASLIEGDNLRSGSVADVVFDNGQITAPDLSLEPHTLVLTYADGCELVAIGCNSFDPDLQTSIVINMQGVEPGNRPMPWCVDSCCDAPDGGQPVDPMGCTGVEDGSPCPDAPDLTCCNETCGQGACCDNLGEACEAGGGEVCCRDTRRCEIWSNCGCDRQLPGDQCELDGMFGECRENVNVCVTDLMVSDCNPPFVPRTGGGCTLDIVVDNPIPEITAVGLEFYQLDQAFDLRRPYSALQSVDSGRTRLTFVVGPTPPTEVRVCSRGDACARPEDCPCDPTQPELAFGTFVGTTDEEGGPRLGIATSLTVVYASEALPERTLTTFEAFSALDLGTAPEFFGEIPAGFSLWQTDPDGMVPVTMTGTEPLTPCSSCEPPLARR